MKTIIVSLFFLFSIVLSDPIVGKWRTIDDETKRPKSIVEITIDDGKLNGKILKIFPEEGKSDDPLCKVGPRKGEKIVGMKIITALTKDGDKWEGDEGIHDPKKGKTYDCKIWLESEDKLAVRGYIGFFFRTQYWERVE